MSNFTIAMILSNIAAFVFGWFVCCVFSDKVESWCIKENEELQDKNMELLDELGRYHSLCYQRGKEIDCLKKDLKRQIEQTIEAGKSASWHSQECCKLLNRAMCAEHLLEVSEYKKQEKQEC